MPRGRPNKSKRIAKPEHVEDLNVNDGNPKHREDKNGEEKERQQETKVDVLKESPAPIIAHEKAAPSAATRIAESRTSLEQPLAPGQKYFESPEGHIVIGEADKGHVWCRQSNNGKGAWINPKR